MCIRDRDIRYAANPNDMKRYTTEELRREFHISGLFQPDRVTATYSLSLIHI